MFNYSFNRFLFSLPGISLEGIMLSSCVCVSVKYVCLAYYWTDQPRIVCAHVLKDHLWLQWFTMVENPILLIIQFYSISPLTADTSLLLTGRYEMQMINNSFSLESLLPWGTMLKKKKVTFWLLQWLKNWHSKKSFCLSCTISKQTKYWKLCRSPLVACLAVAAGASRYSFKIHLRLPDTWWTSYI